jgi:phosphoglycolate phosphatase
MRYDLVLWDFDGTLADSWPLGLAIFNEVAALRGLRPVVDPDAAREMTAVQLMRKHGVSWWRLPRLAVEMKSLARDRIASVQIFPGIAPVLHKLCNHGCRLGIVSSNNEETILTSLRLNGLAEPFEFVHSCSNLFGKGRRVRALLKQLRVRPERVIYVGDEVRDIVAARQARIDVAAVTWGLNSARLLASHEPTYLVDEPADLLPLLLPAGQPAPGT